MQTNSSRFWVLKVKYSVSERTHPFWIVDYAFWIFARIESLCFRQPTTFNFVSGHPGRQRCIKTGGT